MSEPALAPRLGEAAERYARESLDWDALVRRLRTEVYAKVVAEQQGAADEPRRRARRRHYGTRGLDEQVQLSKAYDAVAENTVLYPEFYAWVADRILKAGVPRDATLLGVGCGTGRMLSTLSRAGFSRL